MTNDVHAVDEAFQSGASNARAIDSVFSGGEKSGGGSVDVNAAEEAAKRASKAAAAAEAAATRPEASVPVLFKHRSDALSQATLELSADSFALMSEPVGGAGRRKQLRKEPYASIACLIARARPFHVDVRLSKGTRVRFASSHIQQAMSELALRARLPAEAIVFEPNVRRFGLEGVLDDESSDDDDDDDEDDDEDDAAQQNKAEKNNDAETKETKKENEEEKEEEEDKEDVLMEPDPQVMECDLSFVRKPKEKERPGVVADETASKAIEKSDKDVEEISSVLGELKVVADVMGRELERQTKQLAELSNDVDGTTDKGYGLAGKVCREWRRCQLTLSP
eukprot:TRINITY_DN455_c2_g1_i2.p1 TRINITY_DN455_c2_g1~~TRINITY_DN455_c2_g1_i2.p1  ORF type:complete len:365 (-),score=133.24 TRINITY_DN455_c2_g1_i2:20-1030(-)